MSDKERIMLMFKEGKVSLQEALQLLEAIQNSDVYTSSNSKGAAKMLRIAIDSEEVRVKVNLPVSLARFAAHFIPPEAKEQLSAQGIEISGLLDMLKNDLPEGRLVDMEVSESESKKPTQVVIEVV
ncbi:MAG: hypothetical protein NZ849_09255 [Meiothermus sp.]|uniref:hypothetical protein n=1 Tax=Meiothermus sp. TaxID=1955249 RepID=UPI0025DEC0FD|nr:hypothetical protein [Meiothermus sp.]MCS7058906.1 hypothetical protein [Meiothermus sp.]MCS7195077.1 hypothetical protein [Meiothermus sp.]MCX7740416.1 hypothetical protein [Meiothermus sp.]MDW8090129.1 hypothetical protein [Meiothermus sp.]MDW8481432.1 hypothetical protein [Meiothermus sp.]